MGHGRARPEEQQIQTRIRNQMQIQMQEQMQEQMQQAAGTGVIQVPTHPGTPTPTLVAEVSLAWAS
jgi:hypothetical protein